MMIKKYSDIFNSRIDNVISSRQARTSDPSLKQRHIRDSFIRCSIYWNELNEAEKAEIYNQARKEGKRYFNYFMEKIQKERLQGNIPECGYKIKSYKAPGPSPKGIITSKNNIYISDSSESAIFCLNLSTEVEKAINLTNITPHDITIFNEHIWLTDETDKLFQIDFEGNVIDIINIDNKNLKSITSSTNLLYLHDKNNNEILTYNPNSNLKKIFHQFKNTSLTGIAWDKSNLWYSHYENKNNRTANFNLQDYEPSIDNKTKVKLQYSDSKIYNLTRLSNSNDKFKIDISINDIKIPLNNLSISKDYIYTIDPNSSSIHQIRMVVDLP